MKKMFTILCFLYGVSFSQQPATEQQPWEKLGLSKTEWMMILDNNIPMSKVEQLLKSGIDIGEYVNKPWEKLNISEDKWIDERRAGKTSYEIELESSKDSLDWKSGIKDGFKADVGGMSGNGEAVASLLLPGSQQIKTHRKAAGIAMISLAAGSVVWCTAGSISRKRFVAAPVFCILIPDMIWSYVDHKIYLNRKKREL